jgi:uncharacterized protein (DUF1015 family)
MAQIFPFRAYRYNPERAELSKVLTQPYDKITAAMQRRYYELDPHNLVRVERGRVEESDTLTSNVYTRAAQTLEQWIADGILVPEGAPAVYIYSQEYTLPGVRTRHGRKGFIALGPVEDYSAGVVFRHELTHAGPKADRLELLRHTCAHTGQLFMLYPDPGRSLDGLLERLARPAPAVAVSDEYGGAHRLWPVTDTAEIAEFVRGMADKKLIIADGHHRYETALAFRDECRAKFPSAGRDAPHEKVMMTFFPAHGSGLAILPTHRLVRDLPDFDFQRFRRAVEPYFDWYSYPFANQATRSVAQGEFLHDLAARGRNPRTGRRAIGVYPAGQSDDRRAFFLFLLKRDADLHALLPGVPPEQHQLDVVLLHRMLLERGLGVKPEDVEQGEFVAYEREIDASMDAVDGSVAQMACLLNPVRIEQIIELALAGQVLPQKSTDFYPKLLSGITIYRME